MNGGTGTPWEEVIKATGSEPGPGANEPGQSIAVGRYNATVALRRVEAIRVSARWGAAVGAAGLAGSAAVLGAATESNEWLAVGLLLAFILGIAALVIIAHLLNGGEEEATKQLWDDAWEWHVKRADKNDAEWIRLTTGSQEPGSSASAQDGSAGVHCPTASLPHAPEGMR